MKHKLISFSLAVAGFALLAGCGSGGGISPNAPKDTLLESEKCIGCHDGTDADHSNWKTPGSGKSIVTEWKASSHNSRTNGASCQDCHGSGYLHPVSCNKCHSVGGAGSNPLLNPDAEDKCADCHAKDKFDGFNELTYSNPLIPARSTTAFTHFSSVGVFKRANYVATNYKQNCRKCHNPHDNLFGREQRKQWAESGHGSLTTLARTSRDFKEFGSSMPAYDNFGSFCVRCHTTTGFLNYIKDGAFTDVQALPDSNASKTRTNYPAYVSVNAALGTWTPAYMYEDKTREATNCNACHEDARASNAGTESSYSGRVRRVPQVVSYYSYESSIAQGTPSVKQRYKLPSTISYANLPASNYVTPDGGNWGLQLKDFGLSNVCVACHSGREIGMMIKVVSVGNPEINAVEAGRSLPLDFTKANSAVSPHDRAAATNLSGISGFEFYALKTKYVNPPPPAGRPARHEQLGLAPNYYGDPERKGNGPCITCHVVNNSKSHLFLPVDSTDNIISTTCNGCHSAQPIDIAKQKEGFAAALKALRFVGFHVDSYNPVIADTGYEKQFQLTLNSITKRSALTAPVNGTSREYPELDNEASSITVQTGAATFSTGHSSSRWGVFGRALLCVPPAVASDLSCTTFVDSIVPGSGNPLGDNAISVITAGAYTMGASFNYTLLNNDPGAFAHNPTYVKRLIYDSIDWLDDGVMNESVLDPANPKRLQKMFADLSALSAWGSGGANPAVFESVPSTSVTIVLHSGSAATATTPNTYKFSKFTLTADELAKAIAFICGTTGVRP